MPLVNCKVKEVPTEAVRFFTAFWDLADNDVRPTPKRISQIMYTPWDASYKSHNLNGRLSALYRKAMIDLGFVQVGRFCKWEDTKDRRWL